ncbi:MAG: hypothetical protein ACRDSN_15135 [Pseudonocardiaceae bacterium]
MPGAQVAVTGYCPAWWPANTRLLIRRVRLDPAQISTDPRSRRRCTLTNACCPSTNSPTPKRSTPTRSS